MQFGQEIESSEYKVLEVKKASVPKAAASFDKYPAAGGKQASEFFHSEDHASGAAVI